MRWNGRSFFKGHADGLSRISSLEKKSTRSKIFKPIDYRSHF